VYRLGLTPEEIIEARKSNYHNPDDQSFWEMLIPVYVQNVQRRKPHPLGCG
jgi:hypothetical protein